MRQLVTLACEECKRRNYHTVRTGAHPGPIQLKKYCPWDRKHTIHRETR